MATKILFRRDTEANWSSVNPILSQGEVGFDLTNEKFKIGNGTDDWNTLNYTLAGDFATQEEAEIGTINDKYMTPLRTKQAIEELSPPTDVSVEYSAGVIETNANVNTQFWTGTQAEYDAIETYDDDTLYIIKEV